MDVAGRVEPRRGPAERSPEPLPRGTALGAAAQEEIQGDRIQAGARQRAAALGADRADQPDREMAAALGPLDRKRGVWGKSGSGRGDLGGRSSHKKKTNEKYIIAT